MAAQSIPISVHGHGDQKEENEIRCRSCTRERWWRTAGTRRANADRGPTPGRWDTWEEMSGYPTEDPRADESRVDGTETGREGGFLPAVREDTLALMKRPTDNPMVLGPKIPVPEQSFPASQLFTEEQMKQAEEMDKKAPLFSGAGALRDVPASSAGGAHLALEDLTMGNAFATPEVRRPAFLADEEQKMTETPSPLWRMTTGGGFSGGLHPGVYGGVHNGMHGYGAMPDLVMAILHQAQQENERLRTEYASMAAELDSMRRAKLELEAEKETHEKVDFETPESQLGKKQKSSEVDLEEERMGLYDVTPMEQFQKLQTMMDEAVEPKHEVEDYQVLHAAHIEERSRRFCRRRRTERTWGGWMRDRDHQGREEMELETMPTRPRVGMRHRILRVKNECRSRWMWWPGWWCTCLRTSPRMMTNGAGETWCNTIADDAGTWWYRTNRLWGLADYDRAGDDRLEWWYSHFWWAKVMQECDIWYKDWLCEVATIAEGDVFHPTFGGAEEAEADEGGTQSYEHVDGCNPEWCQGRADQHEGPVPDEARLQADDALPTWWHSGKDGGFETAGRSWWTTKSRSYSGSTTKMDQLA